MARPRVFQEPAVIKSAMQLFWSNGYEATSVQDLVDHTGLSRSSMYDSIGDKRALYIRTLDLYLQTVMDGLTKLVTEGPGNPLDKLEYALHTITTGDDGCLLANCCVELAHKDKEISEIYTSASQKLVGAVEYVLGLAKQTEGLKAGIDIPMGAQLVFSHLQGIQLRRRGGLPLEKAHAELSNIVNLLRA